MDNLKESNGGNFENSPNKSEALGIDKFRNYFDSAIFLTLITAATLALLYSFNGGYNFYYGMPLFLATTSPSMFLENLPFLCRSFILMGCLIFAVIFVFKIIIRVLKTVLKKVLSEIKFLQGKELISYIKKRPKRVYRAFTMIILIVVLFVSFYFKSMVVSVISLVFLVVLFTKIWTQHIQHINEKLYEGLYEDDENISLEEKIQKLEKLRDEALMTKLRTNILIPICIFLLLFSLAFTWGGKKASLQEAYYFIGEDKIAVSIFETYIVATNVWRDNETNQFKCGGEYYLLPMEGIKMTLVETGPIESVALKKIERFLIKVS